MRISGGLLKTSGGMLQQIDFRSLRVRLTLGIAAVSAIGMGAVAFWTSWNMQQVLVNANKQNIENLAGRFGHDVKIYGEMGASDEALQKAIDNLTGYQTLLWFKNPQGKLVAESEQMPNGSLSTLQHLADIPPQPEVRFVAGRYWVLCVGPVHVQEKYLGEIYLAQDMTRDQTMLLSMISSLGVASVLAIASITIIIAVHVRRSLDPLQKISQLAETISPEHLVDAQLHLENAPTEVRELAFTLDQMLLRLHEAWENQRQFVSNVSHELRTPLTVVSGYLQSTLRRASNLSELQREALTIAATEAEFTIQVLQDLLELARADNGNICFHWETILLNELVEEVVAMARQYSNRTIDIESDKYIFQIKGDRNRLKQVLLNLIDNAVKYSNVDQAVTVKLSSHREQVLIQVCDHGIGIPLKQQTRIFERFYRVDESRCRSTGGTGLGLSIVKTLVEGMGGTVGVHSQLGSGSVFTVTLPRIEN